MKFIVSALILASVSSAFAMNCPLQALKQKLAKAEKGIEIAQTRLEFFQKHSANISDIQSEVLESEVYIERARKELDSADQIKGSCIHNDIAFFEMQILDAQIHALNVKLNDIEYDTLAFAGPIIEVTASVEEVKAVKPEREIKERSRLEYR